MKKRITDINGHLVCTVDERTKTIAIKKGTVYTVIHFNDDKPFTVDYVSTDEYDR